MKFSGRFAGSLILLVSSFAACAQSELDVRIKPANKELKANVEGYIGSLGDRDEEALLRFSRGAEEQARKAAQALGYYQAHIESEVKGGKPPHLVLKIEPGEPVHLRDARQPTSSAPPERRRNFVASPPTPAAPRRFLRAVPPGRPCPPGWPSPEPSAPGHPTALPRRKQLSPNLTQTRRW